MKDLGSVIGRKSDVPAFRTVFEQFHAELSDDVSRRKDHVAGSPRFNVAISILIVLNAVITGVEVDQYRGDRLEDRFIFFICDFAFFLVFFSEMLVRMNQLGWNYFTDPWNIFDYTLVVLNCSDLVASVNRQESASLKLASTLRAFRLLRVVRVIRGLRLFHGLWIIIQGILDSLRTITWVGILFLVVTYCVAVVITTLVSNDAHARERWDHCEQYLGTPWRSMWTIMQVITLDNWAVDIARPLSEVSPVSVVLLIIAIIVCTFGIANIIIAVMVEHVQTIMDDTTSVNNKVLEQTELDILKSMGEDFQLADLDGNGELGFEEFRAMLRTPNIVYKLQLLGIHVDEAEQLFELMDADRSGAVSPEEFVLGLQKLQGHAKGQDLVALICCAQKQCMRASMFVERIRHLNEKADQIQERLNRVGTDMTGEIITKKSAAHRHGEVWKTAADRQNVISKLDLNRQIEFPALKEGNAKYGILY